MAAGIDQTGLLGVSWRNATASAIARFTLPRDGRGAHLRALAAALEVEELVYLATCNRVEVLFAGGAPLAIHERRRRLHAHVAREARSGSDAERLLRAWEGDGLIEHLFLVAAGLDSARAGESEVTGQLRLATGESQAEGLLGPRLKPLLDEAFGVARRVRPITEGRIGRASLADIAVARVRERLAQRPGPVALVGISPMTERCATALAREGVPLLIVNRTVARAEALALQVGGTPRALADFHARPDAVAAVVLATASSAPVLDAEALRRLGRASPSAPLLVDLGVPPNLRREDALDAGCIYIDMDGVTRAAEAGRERAIEELGEARALVDDALESRRRRQWTAVVDPAIVELRRRFESRAHEELDRALQQELAGLDPNERDAVRRLTETLVQRLAHVPTRGLRDLAGHAGPAAVAAFLGTAAPDLAAALRARAPEAAPWEAAE